MKDWQTYCLRWHYSAVIVPLTLWSIHLSLPMIDLKKLVLGDFRGHWLRIWSQNLRWRIQYGGPKFEKSHESNAWCKSHENVYLGILGVADYESVVRFQKYKMVDLIRQLESEKQSWSSIKAVHRYFWSHWLQIPSDTTKI